MSSDRWEEEYLSPFDLIELLVPLDSGERMGNVSDFLDIVGLNIDQSTGEIVMIYYVSKNSE